MVLDSGSGGIRTASLFAEFAGRAVRVVENLGALEAKSKLVEPTADAQFLDVREREVSELDVPTQPEFLAGD